jgi:hypothetical protein
MLAGGDMNKTLMNTALGCLLGAATWMTATLAVAAQAQTVQVRPGASYRLSPDDFDAAYARLYELRNGQLLELRHSARHFYARLAGAPEVELYPQAPDVFLTSTGATVLFRDDGDTIVVRGFERIPGNGRVR